MRVIANTVGATGAMRVIVNTVGAAGTMRVTRNIVGAVALAAAALFVGCKSKERPPTGRRNENRPSGVRPRAGPPRGSPVHKTPAGWPTAHVLKNGLRVYLLPSPAKGHVSVLLAFGVGSAHDPKTHVGLTHMIEHLLIRARTSADGTSSAADLKSVAVSMNGETMHNFSYVYAVARADKLEPLLGTWARRWRSLAFDAKTISVELGRILQEKKFVKQSGPARLLNAVFGAVYRKSRPRRWGKRALLETTGPFKPEAVRRFFKAHYLASGAVAVVAGDLNPSNAEKLARKHLSASPSGNPPALKPLKYTPLEKKPPPVSVTSPNMKGWQTLIAWPAPQFLSDEDAALTAAGMILQQHLYRSLVVTGLLRTAAAHNDVLSGPGHLFMVQLTSPAGGTLTPRNAIKILWSELTGLAVTPSTHPTHLATAYRRNMEMSVRLQSFGGRAPAWAAAVQSAINLARVELTLGKKRHILTHRMGRLTAKKIQQAVARYLTPDKAVIGTLSAK